MEPCKRTALAGSEAGWGRVKPHEEVFIKKNWGVAGKDQLKIFYRPQTKRKRAVEGDWEEELSPEKN